MQRAAEYDGQFKLKEVNNVKHEADEFWSEKSSAVF